MPGIGSSPRGCPPPMLRRWLLVLSFALLRLVSAPVHAAQPCDHAVELDQAVRTVTREGRVLDERTVRPPDALPLAWRREDVRIRYRIALPACAGASGHALWLYRLGAPYRVRVDDRPLVPLSPTPSLRQPPDAVYNGRVPALFALPPGGRELEIELATIPYLSSGIVHAVTGPPETLQRVRITAHDAIIGVNDAATAVIAIVGVLAIVVWGMRTRDRMVLWFGLACASWALRGWAYQAFVYPLPPLPLEQLNPWMVLTATCCLSLTAHHSFGRVTRRYARALGGLYATVTGALVITLWLGEGAAAARGLAFISAFSLLCYTLVAMARHWWHQRSVGHGLVVVGLAALVVAGAHDLGMVVGWVNTGHWAFITPAFTLLLLAHTAAVTVYVVRSLQRAEEANEELERAIAAKSRELEHSYALLRESERASARAQERARLTRELHDGLGAHLITALRGVERGSLGGSALAQTLQESIDELRLLMDSTDLGPSLLDALMAWRHRWEPRLQALDLALEWSVDPALDRLELGSETTLQLMRILQEAVTNALRHARGRRITVRAQATAGPSTALVLEVSDDGQGYTPPAPGHPGRGLNNMHQRAQRLGGHLTVARVAPPDSGTCVRLTLPLPAHATAPERNPSRL